MVPSKFFVFAFFAALILSFGLAVIHVPNADATTTVISANTSGTLLMIGKGDTLIIKPWVTFSPNSLDNRGTILNRGTPTNDAVADQINNYGTIINAAPGSITGIGKLTNTGTLTNDYGAYLCLGQLDNSGLVDNSGIINNISCPTNFSNAASVVSN